MLIDYHLHSTFSNDSEAALADICQQAVAMGLAEIAITDHVDLQYPVQPPGYIISDMDCYFETLQHYQKQYSGQLTIRIGMEIGLEPHSWQTYDRLIASYPFDFIIASLHAVEGMEPHLGVYYEGKSKEEAYRVYYEHILEYLNQYDNFDILCHLDYVKRYMPYPYQPGDHLLAIETIDAVLTKLIAMGKGLEINTSGFRHISHASMPHFDIIARYHALGGKRLTIGSDSHAPQYVGTMVSQTLSALADMGIETFSTFEKRKERRIAISGPAAP